MFDRLRNYVNSEPETGEHAIDAFGAAIGMWSCGVLLGSLVTLVILGDRSVLTKIILIVVSAAFVLWSVAAPLRRIMAIGDYADHAHKIITDNVDRLREIASRHRLRMEELEAAQRKAEAERVEIEQHLANLRKLWSR